MQTTRSPEQEPREHQQAAAVMRAFSILYNTSRVYGAGHPVFKKTLAVHMSAFQDALADAKELRFSFLKGETRCDRFLLDPGSKILQSLAHTLEGMGVSGLSIRRGANAEEISRLIAILTLRASDVSAAGLQKLLDRERVAHIAENKVRLDTDGKTVQAPSVRGKETPAACTTFDLDDAVADLETELGGEAGRKPAATAGTRPFKDFVKGALTDLARQKADIVDVAERISNEFEQRLNEETGELRREKEKALRRLESLKNVVFEKLESLNVMAVLVDTDLDVLALTSPARDFLGNISTIPHDSPLAVCIKLQGAHMDITLKDKSIAVQTMVSDSLSAGETFLLLTLNPE